MSSLCLWGPLDGSLLPPAQLSSLLLSTGEGLLIPEVTEDWNNENSEISGYGNDFLFQILGNEGEELLKPGTRLPWAVASLQWEEAGRRGSSLQKIYCFGLRPVPPSDKSLSRVRLFATPQTVAHQVPLSMGFSRQKYWSGLPFPPPRDLPDPGVKPPLVPPEKPHLMSLAVAICDTREALGTQNSAPNIRDWIGISLPLSALYPANSFKVF